jgi:hypothetical protein
MIKLSQLQSTDLHQLRTLIKLEAVWVKKLVELWLVSPRCLLSSYQER